MSDGYLSKLFFWMLAWMILLFIFIGIIDPYGVSPIKIHLRGINVYKPNRLDIDRLIKPYEVWLYQPRTIFMGTSRIHQSIDPAVFDGTSFAPAYNASIPASTLAENEAHIEQFLKLDPHIKDIFIELFFYNFIQGTGAPVTKSWQEWIGNTLSLQMSSDALVDALHTIASNRRENSMPAHIAPRGYRIQYSGFNPASTFNPSVFIHTVIGWNRASKMVLQPSALHNLDRILQFAKAHHIHLHLLLTPNYPWDDYRLMSLGYWPMLEKWLRLMATYPNVVSFSQYNTYLEEAPVSNPKMKWWNDPIHFSLNMGRVMMNAFLGHPLKDTPANIMRPLNPQTVEAVIAERRQGLLHWAATHPDFVSDFEEAKQTDETVSGKLDEQASSLIVNGQVHPIVLGVGEVSLVDLQGTQAVVSGWSADEKAKRHVKQLIATIGENVVATGYPTVDRADMDFALGKSFFSGFAMQIPLTTWDGTSPIRVFAIMKNNDAVQLTSDVNLIKGLPFAQLGFLQKNQMMINHHIYPLVKYPAGHIENKALASQGYIVSGNIMKSDNTAAIVAVVDNKIVAKTLLTIKRADKQTGFTINVPLNNTQRQHSVPIALFALLKNGTASKLEG